jgi:hypothetical protein
MQAADNGFVTVCRRRRDAFGLEDPPRACDGIDVKPSRGGAALSQCPVGRASVTESLRRALEGQRRSISYSIQRT